MSGETPHVILRPSAKPFRWLPTTLDIALLLLAAVLSAFAAIVYLTKIVEVTYNQPNAKLQAILQPASS